MNDCILKGKKHKPIKLKKPMEGVVCKVCGEILSDISGYDADGKERIRIGRTNEPY